MPKISQEIEENDFADDFHADDGPESSENQPLRTLSHEASDEDVNDFTETNGLSGHLELFHKASEVLVVHSSSRVVLPLTTVEREALDRETTRKWHQPRTLYFTIFVCSLGAIEQGWAQTGMNGANLYLPHAFDLEDHSARSSFVLGIINSGLYLAQGLIGAWISEPVNNHLGRRGAIFVATLCCLIGNAGSGMAFSWPILVLFRLVLGTGLGLNSSTVNVFAAESAPAYIRGGLAVSWQMFTAFGIFLGFLANVIFVMQYTGREELIWRLQLAAPLIPAIPLLILVYNCPESPAWHIKRHSYSSAFASLLRLRNTPLQAAIELYSTNLSRRRNKIATALQPRFLSKLKSLFQIPRNRHALYASYTVMLGQQLCGINIIAFYSSTIFSSSGSSPLLANWASVVFGLVNFVGAFPAVWTMDRYGRRWLLLWTLPPMALTMALASASFWLPGSTLRLVVLAGCVYVFCALYSPGMGPVPCAYSAEVYPLSVREVGMSFAISTAALWATVLSLTFPVLLETLGEQASFGLYAALNLVAWGLSWAFVRETKGVELERMDEVFEGSSKVFLGDAWRDGIVTWRRRRIGKGWQEVGQEDRRD